MTARVENSKPERVRLAALTQFARKNGLQIGIIGVMLGIWLLFIIGASDTFLKPDIYRALMTSVPYWGVIALPLTMVIIAGDIDLSFISIMAVGMVVFWEAYETTSSLGVAFAASLVSGFLVGLLNGIIVVRLGIPALIATIGTQFFWRGVVEVIRRGQGESLTLARDTVLRDVLVSKVGGYVPAQVIWMVLVALAVWFLLNRHKLGAHTYLIGDNEASARLMGVNVGRTRMLRGGGLRRHHPEPGRVVLLAEPGRRLPDDDAGRGVPGRHVGVRRDGHHPGHVRRLLHHRRHPAGDHCHRADRLLDQADLRPDHHRVGCHARVRAPSHGVAA